MLEYHGIIHEFPTEYRKARKEHRCSGCHQVIKPGEVYRRTAHVEEIWLAEGGIIREVDYFKACPDCLTWY